MATLNGNNYALEVAKPQKKIENGAVYGSLHNLRESYTLVGDVLALNDEILGPILPAGAIVLDAKLKISATLGTGGILELGHKASDNIAEDSDAFITGADAGGQAVLARPAAANVGIYKKFDEAVRTFAKVTEASSVSEDVTINWDITYVMN